MIGEKNEDILDEWVYDSKEKPELYSSRAIFGFSILFMAVFGAVLLRTNLIEVGKRKEGNRVLVGGIIYSLLTLIVVNIPNDPIVVLSLLLNGGAGSYMGVVLKKHIPRAAEHPKKPIGKPIVISLGIIAFFVLLAIVEVMLLE